MFLPLTKADQEKHLVYARAAAEELDKSREIMDYVTAVPQFKAWSNQYSSATLGKSFGNIRAMHNPKHLAGKVQEITYNDDAKAIDVCIKVLDPVDWAKVEEGGYTGLSIGGGYLKKWKDSATGATRYTPRIQEISFVDSPCIPSARIMEMQKADGTTEEVLLKGVARTFGELLPPPTFAQLNKAIAPIMGSLSELLKAGVHPGFNRAAASIENREGVSAESAHAILAAGARRASKGAVKANPRLKRIRGVGKQELIDAIAERLAKGNMAAIPPKKKAKLANAFITAHDIAHGGSGELGKGNGMLLQPDNTRGIWLQGMRDKTQRTPFFGSMRPRKPLFPGIPGATATTATNVFGKIEDMAKQETPNTPEARAKIKQTLHEFKHGRLKSFRAGQPKSKMPRVTNRSQAIAIALSQARRMGKAEPAFVVALAKHIEVGAEQRAGATGAA